MYLIPGCKFSQSTFPEPEDGCACIFTAESSKAVYGIIFLNKPQLSAVLFLKGYGLTVLQFQMNYI